VIPYEAARSAPSSGWSASSRESVMWLPSDSSWRPVSAAVCRRSLLAGVLSRRCATLSAAHARATTIPAGETLSALTQYEV
jgi:hypothetical protein